MAGRIDAALAAALQAMAQAVGNRLNAEDAGIRSLATFQRENPPTFKGRCDPSGALAWLKEMERIFRVMDCTAAQKVRFGTHMLSEEADDWWLGCRQRLLNAEEEITWALFTREFLRKYYPEDVRRKKEIEFLELKQGNMLVTEYAAKFTELAKLYSHYNGATTEFSECIKFERGLRDDIRKAIGPQKVRVFSVLIDSCRIFEENINANSRVMRDRQKNFSNRGQPYEVPAGRGKQRAAVGQRISGGDAPSVIVCFKCGLPGHKRSGCRAGEKKCYQCGVWGHRAAECGREDVVCFNCGKGGHIRAQCPKLEGEESSGRVLAMAGSDAVDEIEGT